MKIYISLFYIFNIYNNFYNNFYNKFYHNIYNNKIISIIIINKYLDCKFI